MAAAMKKLVAVFTTAFFVSTAAPSVSGAETHHVVGGDRGWDVDSDIGSWSASRNFKVGDKIWFAYSVAHGNVVEVKSKEEYEACDVSKFTKMYTDGIDIVALNGEGIRYFASSKAENCKKGLKLHVIVQAQAQMEAEEKAQAQTTEGVERIIRNDVSDGDSGAVPPTPSTSSPPFTPLSYLTLTLLLIGLAFTYWIS